jgi:hypothetical protein
MWLADWRHNQRYFLCRLFPVLRKTAVEPAVLDKQAGWLNFSRDPAPASHHVMSTSEQIFLETDSKRTVSPGARQEFAGPQGHPLCLENMGGMILTPLGVQEYSSSSDFYP